MPALETRGDLLQDGDRFVSAQGIAENWRDCEKKFMRKREGTGIPGKSPKRLGLFSSARSQFARRLVRMVLPIDFGGALQRLRDAVAEIFRADTAVLKYLLKHHRS